jgi:predicted NBD/HSP70 family sugar kinase
MYLSVDIGGTKTLVAVYDENGNVSQEARFPTGDDYDILLGNISKKANELIDVDNKIKSVAVAIPVPIDYKTGISKLKHKFGWKERNVTEDLKTIFSCPVVCENDANLAALGEAVLGSGKGFKTVLYVTLSTGIGTGVISNEEIVPVMAASEGGFFYLHHDGKQKIWEDFASGKAFTERYGKMGSEVDDPKIWEEYASTLSAGFINLINAVRPDIVVVGGGMGAHLKKYKKYLMKELEELNEPLHSYSVPDVVLADLPERAVVHGGYLLAKSIAQE